MIVTLQFGFQFTLDIPLLVRLAPLFLILAGSAAAGRLLERAFRVVPVVGSGVQLLIRIIVYLGIIIGIFCIISGVQTWLTGNNILQSFSILYLAAISGVQSVYGFTFYMLGLIIQYKYYFWLHPAYTYGILILVGFALLMKPIKAVPWAAVIALLVGGGVTVLVWKYFNITETTWLIVVFIAVLLLTYLLFKFIEDLLKILAMILTFPIIAVPFGLICIVQGILLLIGSSLGAILAPLLGSII
ncbi:MAG: hypothetical protein Q6366_017155 [Candidatus Freyarchaeota archaeon]